ncbi:hypothetical protein H6G33_09640 [Calothrix sp. FACHB-1219]|uniref:hypothetical protein n=1 Tax=unclassified Calothrix TaxID=2619626 RepID=UPI00168A288C|nr:MULTISPECIES: hypothetical protein [unclassified Calothrix]MBD2201609.1 hypothetical protein [Calothrix sp. FACHB-168]MBD2217295.1 hypothetical protein [Calothrix sp. FACHB-1219]
MKSLFNEIISLVRSESADEVLERVQREKKEALTNGQVYEFSKEDFQVINGIRPKYTQVPAMWGWYTAFAITILMMVGTASRQYLMYCNTTSNQEVVK